MLVDSHVNLHAPAFAEDRDPALARARAAGVGHVVAVTSRLCEHAEVLAIARGHPDVSTTIGAHPHHAKDRPDLDPAELIALAEDPKVIAIGETGLDRHYNYSPFEDQVASFRAHIAAARATGLPLIVHAREADAPMAEILEEEYAKGAFLILLHCYTSGRDLARRGAALGAAFSVNGIATFKTAEDVRAIILEEMPPERIILETDSPYLAPMPHRGKRNEPAFLPLVAEKLAALRGWSLEETAERTTQAFYRLFAKAARP